MLQLRQYATLSGVNSVINKSVVKQRFFCIKKPPIMLLIGGL